MTANTSLISWNKDYHCFKRKVCQEEVFCNVILYFQNPYLYWIKEASLLEKEFLYTCKEVEKNVDDNKKELQLE